MTFHRYSCSFIRLAIQSTHHSSSTDRRCCIFGRGEDELIIDVVQLVGHLVLVKSLLSFFAYPYGFFEPSSAIYDLCLLPVDSVISGGGRDLWWQIYAAPSQKFCVKTWCRALTQVFELFFGVLTVWLRKDGRFHQCMIFGSPQRRFL